MHIDDSSDTANRDRHQAIPDSIQFDFGSSRGHEVTVGDVFSEFTRRLQEKYDINRGVLILCKPGSSKLAAVSTWHNGAVHDGLSINLPDESSLFAKVAEEGHLYTDDFYGVFSGNFFERKLLLDENSRSFALHPLKRDGRVIGLVGYSSEKPTAFSVFEEGVLQDAVDQMSALLAQKSLEM